MQQLRVATASLGASFPQSFDVQLSRSAVISLRNETLMLKRATSLIRWVYNSRKGEQKNKRITHWGEQNDSV